METVATVLYARLHNVPSIRKSLPPERKMEFEGRLGDVLKGPISEYQGHIAQARPDSILAVFTNESWAKPDHGARAAQAATLGVHRAAELRTQLAMHAPGKPPLPLMFSAGVHLGKVELNSASVQQDVAVSAFGETVEIARVLQSTAWDMRWSIVGSGAARRAMGGCVESGRFGSVMLPDSSFVDINEITGLAPQKDSPPPAAGYQALRDAIAHNQGLYPRPQGIPGAGTEAAGSAAVNFSIEGYRILRKIGEGGMASIYLVEADKADKPQVLKVMRILNAGEADALQRFLQEFALLAQVRHPNIARIYRQSFSAGHAYIAMEYFPLGDLRARIAKGLGGKGALFYLKQIASALGAIHRVGIVHRDLKPDNLMLREDGSLALADFGIAKHVSMRITATSHGEVVGSPYYLSPEQAIGEPVDQRSDFYSLGVMLYEMLTGTKPYRAASLEALLDLHANGPVPRLEPSFGRLQPILNRLMAKDRDQRYGDAKTLLNDLAPFGISS